MALSKSLNELNLLDDGYIMVASIDFGTTFSGYAFSLRSSKTDIRMNNNWGAGSGLESYKTPTSVLLGKDGNFIAFGYEAETKYSQMIVSNGTESCEIYRHFKMQLHNDKNLSRSTTVESVRGKKALAIDIFTHAVRFLGKHMVDAIGKGVTRPPPKEQIRWVVTVPAIWGVKAKTFMREVALKAGLIPDMNSRQFIICLEPEAASIYCRQLDTSAFEKPDPMGNKLLRKSGTKFMIIDAGGGTIDITAHEIDDTGNVKELVAASGGPWGGTMVDQNFICTVKDIFGADFLNKFQAQYPADWLKLRTDFEMMKKRFNPKDPQSSITFHLSFSLFDAYSKIVGGSLSQKLESCTVQGVKFNNGALMFDNRLTMSIFKPVIKLIVSHLKEEIKTPTLKDIDLVLLVGGFGECQLLQEELAKLLSSKVPLLCPNEAGISIIKGAVLYGHAPQVITSRIARKTYGDDIHTQFDPKVYEAHRRVEKKCGSRCKVFRTYVKKGESVKVGEVKKFTSYPTSPTQTEIRKYLYSADVSDVKYPDEPTVTQIGSLDVELPDISKGLHREVEVSVYFGTTEIHVAAREVTDGMKGKEVKTTIDFLTD